MVTRGFAPLQVRPLRVRPHYDQFAPTRAFVYDSIDVEIITWFGVIHNF